MSFFEDASLVLIPSAQKTSKVYSVKPTDGTGDLTFTRTGDTATRVASNGLIEKVRTNLLLQSNTFSTTWTNTNSTETSGQAGYDGTSNAWLLQSTIASGEAYLRQTISASGSNTFSIYAKAGTANFLAIYINATSGTDPFAYFNLSTGAVGTTSATATASIVSIGSGWYRCSVAYNATISNVDVYVTTADNSFLSTTGDNILIQNAQLEAGDIATQPILTTSAAVSVGPVASVPRLDYLNSSCPRLILEPQRVQLLKFSEQMDNAEWAKTGGTISANVSATVDPSGYNGADKLVGSAGAADQVLVGQSISLGSAGTYTFSFFVKAAEKTWVRLRTLGFDAGGNQQTWFNLSTGAVGTDGFGNSKIVSYGNGWYRCIVSFATTTDLIGSVYAYLADSNNTTNVTRNGTDGLYLWGSMLELGAYATSYIPTLGSASTRGSDAASKTGISSLIGQTEGTLFIDMEFEGYDNLAKWIAFLGTGSSYIGFYTDNVSRFFAEVSNAGVAQFNSSTFVFAVGQRYKLALAYKENDFAFYVNGTQVATDNSGTVPATSQFDFQYNTTANNLTARTYNQALLFKTRLTNAQLAELTTL